MVCMYHTLVVGIVAAILNLYKCTVLTIFACVRIQVWTIRSKSINLSIRDDAGALTWLKDHEGVVVEKLALEKEYAYFNSILSKLKEESYGKFAVIYDGALLNVYTTREEALKNTVKTHKLGTFLVQQIVDEEELPRFFSYRAIFA